ncbi:MAG: class I SAM-dependent methyltransferase [Gammaproteobacteria bacterium]|nr:class I SAM-dependent methyltransferase [Gammaproteobacteria bacterium]
MAKKDKRKHKKQKRKASKEGFTAKTADKHVLYELSVQNVEDEIKFLDEAYRDLRNRPAKSLREDFAGTSAAACEWVRTGENRQAWAVDIDADVLSWGRARHVSKLSAEQQQRIELVEGDVLEVNTPPVDMIIAFNFSYFIFKSRDTLRAYFERARQSIKPDGVLMLDCFGGSEAYEECEEDTDLDDFSYVWDQDSFDPISSNIQCYIHFDFPDGSKIRKAFEYDWRLWTLAEIRELLQEAGFKKSTVYWEGFDEDGEGNDDYKPVERGDADPAWIAYVVAER